jgi:molybdenum cofactor cytidylyltransferase
VDGIRATPVLFDRVTFPALMALDGDVGGRAIFPLYTPVTIPWSDPKLLLDVDTLDDLSKLT